MKSAGKKKIYIENEKPHLRRETKFLGVRRFAYLLEHTVAVYFALKIAQYA